MADVEMTVIPFAAEWKKKTRCIMIKERNIGTKVVKENNDQLTT